MTTCSLCGGDHTTGECPNTVSWEDPTELGLKPAAGALRAGMVVGEYRLTERVGEGGMGVVWAGIHPLIERKVAIKIVENTGASVAARFLKEAQAASRVRHRNIVDVFAFGQLPDGRSYLVMEFLEGESLGAFLASAGPLPFARALPIFDGILNGLRVSHERGIIHRDLKPDNVWLCPPDGAAGDFPTVKLLDFGLAKLVNPQAGKDSVLTRAGTPLGTPGYMSPEQCRGVAEVDARSDIYSVGVMLFLAFAARLPFVGESYIDVITQHLMAEPPSLAAIAGMPPGLVALIERALAKRADDRWQSAAELREALLSCDTMEWIPSVATAVPVEKLGPRALTRPMPVPPRTARAPSAAVSVPVSVPVSVAAPAATASPCAAPLQDGVLLGDLTIQPEREGSTLTLSFQGELDREDGAALLGDHLGRITEAMRDDGVRRVVLDLEGLHFLGSDALGCLCQWLTLLRDLRSDGLAPTTVRYSNTVGWQRSTVPTFSRIDPGLMLEGSDW
ncbi:MAG: hypothetical protein EXR72_07585 [Myxococcales bacterium]|nr:hypothetical protein [Myxococcales bacterium]